MSCETPRTCAWLGCRHRRRRREPVTHGLFWIGLTIIAIVAVQLLD